jgi:hypothetical protein
MFEPTQIITDLGAFKIGPHISDAASHKKKEHECGSQNLTGSEMESTFPDFAISHPNACTRHSFFFRFQML